MRLAVASALLLIPACAHGQKLTPTSAGAYNPTSTFSVGFSGTAPSQNIFSGLAEGRTFLMVAGDWDHQVHRGRKTDYRWEVEVIPLALLRNPRVVATAVISLPGQPTATSTVNELLLAPCVSSSFTVPYGQDPAGSPAGQGTLTYTQTCTREWDYLGGVSPLGQRVSWRPGKPLQPYAIVNAGFLAATQFVPMFNATRFNFTVETGGGVEWFLRDRRSVAFDVRYHHMSNGGRGDNNPGIDNIAFRASYRLGQR